MNNADLLLCEQASGFGNSFLDWSAPADPCELTPTSSLIIHDWMKSSNFCCCQRVWRLHPSQIRRQSTLFIPGILMIYKQVLADTSRTAATSVMAIILHAADNLKVWCYNAGLCAMAELLASAYRLVITLQLHSCLLYMSMSKAFQLTHCQQDKGAWEVHLCSTAHEFEFENNLGYII